MLSSVILRRVALVETDISEERIATIIRETRIGEVRKALAITGNRRTLRRKSPMFVTLMMEVLRSSETSVLQRATRCKISEDGILRIHRSENLKSYLVILVILGDNITVT
jgi:hypothetical protein